MRRAKNKLTTPKYVPLNRGAFSSSFFFFGGGYIYFFFLFSFICPHSWISYNYKHPPVINVKGRWKRFKKLIKNARGVIHFRAKSKENREKKILKKKSKWTSKQSQQHAWLLHISLSRLSRIGYNNDGCFSGPINETLSGPLEKRHGDAGKET